VSCSPAAARDARLTVPPLLRFVQVVKLRCAGKHAANMNVVAQQLEERTGGIVIQRSGSTIYLCNHRAAAPPVEAH
jgi:RNA-binding protein YhbY